MKFCAELILLILLTFQNWGQQYPDQCYGCGSRGSLLHLLWECPDVHILWSKLVSAVNEILHANFPLSPALCLLDQNFEAVLSFPTNCLSHTAFTFTNTILTTYVWFQLLTCREQENNEVGNRQWVSVSCLLVWRWELAVDQSASSLTGEEMPPYG